MGSLQSASDCADAINKSVSSIRCKLACACSKKSHQSVHLHCVGQELGFKQLESCADPEGGQGVRTPPPLKNHKNIGFLSNTGPGPLKNHKATKTAFSVGPSSASQRNAI